MSLRFIDLCAGLGGFHVALSRLKFQCVYASELDEELGSVYLENFSQMRGKLYGDIKLAENKAAVPSHEVLCAGFPCQPFSKSGNQSGFYDKTRGTVFHDILDILKTRTPKYIILENVGNFERHDQGNTWQIVRGSLEELGYEVMATEPKESGGVGLLSPHHLGFPHTRERFFVVGRLGGLEYYPFPVGNVARPLDFWDIVQGEPELSEDEVRETRLADSKVECIKHWNELLETLPADVPLPSFPLWTFEFGATYPYESTTPYWAPVAVLRRSLEDRGARRSMNRDELLSLLPNYARAPSFPTWKKTFIRQNRDWFSEYGKFFPDGWLDHLREKFSHSMQKLEWNCQGGVRDLTEHVLQFRPSGLRTKRITASPTLIAMTTTQIPIIGPRKRLLSRTEARRLFGLPDDHVLPISKTKAFEALGNSVHVDVVEAIARGLIEEVWDLPSPFQYDRAHNPIALRQLSFGHHVT